MKKLVIGLLISLLAIAGCSKSYSYFEASARTEYFPFAVKNVEKGKAAFIKAADGVSIFKVDGERVANMFEAMAGKHDSVLVAEGSHTLVCSLRSNGRDMYIGKAFYKANHEYLVDFASENDGRTTTTHYWVKDLTDNKVIFGKEMTEESMRKKNEPEQ